MENHPFHVEHNDITAAQLLKRKVPRIGFRQMLPFLLSQLCLAVGQTDGNDRICRNQKNQQNRCIRRIDKT